MPRERSNTLRKSPNEIQVGDQVMVLSEIQNREPMLAQIVEIRQIELNKPGTSNDIKMEIDEQSQFINSKSEEKREESQNKINFDEEQREGILCLN